jgi:putative hemolysin
VNTLVLEMALVVALIVLNAGFAGTEMALVRLRQGQLDRLAQDSHAGRVLADLARDPNEFLATLQIGITLAGFLASATAAVSLAEPLHGPLGFLGEAAEPVAVLLVTSVLTFVTLVLGELVPKRLAMQRAERWALVAARPVAGLARLARPIVWLLGRATDASVRLLGSDAADPGDDVTEEELRELLVGRQAFTPTQRHIIEGAFDIAERTLRQVLVPRRQVVALLADQSVSEGLDRLLASGHSRAPVVGHDLDDVVGVVHLRDLVSGDGTVGDRARPATVLPESVGVMDALRRLQTERQQLAIVVNEYGSTAGIVTIEDLIEELVGEIYDETDRDVRAVRREPDGGFVVVGSFPVHDLGDLGIDLPAGDYATIAGLMLERMGRIPDGPGVSVDVDNWRLEVTAVRGRAITEVRLRRT